MCGLAFVATKKAKHTGKRVYDLYAKQKARGQAGYGYIAIQDGKIVSLKRSRDEAGIRKTLLKETAEIILFHHRFPTSTPNTIGTAHPIFVSNDELEFNYLVMHNGVISNHAKLKESHEKLGYSYRTEYQEEIFASHDHCKEFLEYGATKYNDSESLAIEIARFTEGKAESIDTYGGAAVLVVQINKESEEVEDIIYGQNYGRSLGRQDRKGWTLIASEHGKEVDQLKFFHFNPKTFETTETEMVIDEARPVKSSMYNGYNSQPKMALPASKKELGIKNPYNLVNAIYTEEETIDSGAPLSEFFGTTHQLVDGFYSRCFVPTCFTGIATKSRKLFRDTYYHVEVEPTRDKDMVKLEDLAMKWARLKYQSDKVVDLFESKTLDQETYSGKIQRLEILTTSLEEEMSSLGIEEDEVLDICDTAMEFVEYEYEERLRNGQE